MLCAGNSERLIDSVLGVGETGQRSNRTERSPTISVIEGVSRDPEKMRHNLSAIRSADRFQCHEAAKTRAVTTF
jgi:hypothetical protein